MCNFWFSISILTMEDEFVATYDSYCHSKCKAYAKQISKKKEFKKIIKCDAFSNCCYPNAILIVSA